MFKKTFVLLEGFSIGYEAVTLAAALDYELIQGLALLLAGAIVLITFVHAMPNPAPPQHSRHL